MVPPAVESFFALAPGARARNGLRFWLCVACGDQWFSGGRGAVATVPVRRSSCDLPLPFCMFHTFSFWSLPSFSVWVFPW